APRVDVDEHVALEEQARPQLEGGVVLDRLALGVDLHRHDGGLDPGRAALRRLSAGRGRGRVAAVDAAARGVVVRARLDARDLADVHPGDPHRRVRHHVLRGREHGPDLVTVGPGQLLRVGQVRADGHDHDQDQADDVVRKALVLAGSHGWCEGIRVFFRTRLPFLFQKTSVMPREPGRFARTWAGLEGAWPG